MTTIRSFTSPLLSAAAAFSLSLALIANTVSMPASVSTPAAAAEGIAA